ncbi:MAG: aldo/keto reductase, partial [Lachnospiraceae bacterium]|nr:aldo/keto reductase [Lachnospiraceae bacterium]
MIYRDFQDKKLSLLGFGTMRLPMNGDVIDDAQVKEMVAYALEHGVNYFDTAYPYHNGESERAIGRALAEHPRDSFYLATKYPGHQLSSIGYNPAEIFEEQLQKCGVDYFDVYLLHNVNENSIRNYKDPQWKMVEYFR